MQRVKSGTPETRARRKALGMRSTETVLHENDIAALDIIRDRLGLGSRSDAIRVLIARTDPADLTPADASAIQRIAS